MPNLIKRSQDWLTFALIICISLPTSSWALDAKNFDKLKASLGFTQYYKLKKSSRTKVKIAVFDNGFDEYEKSIGSALPADTLFVGDNQATGEEKDTAHGRFMAEILYSMMTNNGESPELAPQIYLFKVTGYSNLKTAIDESIQLKVDIILHSMVREYGSNFDGQGFFNTETNRAIDAGITWINAAGNFGKTSYNLTDFKTDKDNWVELPGKNQALPIRCDEPKNEKKNCNVRIVLSWNDFKDTSDLGTDKDLDLILTDDTLNILQTSNLEQTSAAELAPGQSKYPREILETVVEPGLYFIRIKNRSKNFTNSDTLRIAIDSEFITLENYDKKESLLNPADNPNVITVGASDSDRSSRSVRLSKPEILAPSLVAVSDKEAYLGSSNSAAIVAAGIGLVKMSAPDLGRTELIKLLTAPAFENIIGRGLSTSALNFTSTAHLESDVKTTCFDEVQLKSQPPVYIVHVLKRGGIFVNTSRGLRIVTPFDPIEISPGLRRVRADDMVLMTPQGLMLRPRSEFDNIPAEWAEVFQLPNQMTVCSLPEAWLRYAKTSGNGQTFHMPAPATLTHKK